MIIFSIVHYVIVGYGEGILALTYIVRIHKLVYFEQIIIRSTHFEQFGYFLYKIGILMDRKY